VSAVAGGPVRVALLGFGTVGAAVGRALVENAGLYAGRLGVPLELAGIAVRDLGRPRDLGPVPGGLLTDRAEELVDAADVVVEVMGGIEPARSLVLRALGRGVPVVTANKQLIAQHGPHLHRVADEHRASLDYEAAVVAAVPVLRVVREALAGDRITAISGVVNGSTNFVLDQVARHGMAFHHAVARAGELGYLEADPTEDLEGLDAAAKIVILARAAWGVDVTLDDVQREGITGLDDEDFEQARGTGQVIKLIASAWRSGSSEPPRVELAVRPVRLGADHPMAQVREGRNVVQIESELAGVLRLSGEGAGGEATASAVLGDLMGAVRRVLTSRG
jgi:homoserine dehydrogenase